MNKKEKSSQKGFTLLEILVVVGVLGVVAVIGSNLLFTTLRGSTKARVLVEVKQNGNYAMEVMERMIRNARSLKSQCQSGMTEFRIENPDLGKTTFACLDVGMADPRISSGSGSPLSYVRLTNDKVKVDSCTFDCQRGEKGIRPDTITINFTLSQAQASSRPERQARVDFKTTVTLRNY